MAGIIEMLNVSFSAQSNLIVSDFSYSFEEGKTTALVGSSGSGKSTVLKLSAGLLVPDRGKIFFRDKEIFNMSRQENLSFRKEAAMVFQDSALWANQTLYQNLELPLKIHFPSMSAAGRKERIVDVLREVGYNRDQGIRPAQLSMGEQKLISFARAMICRPTLLFLDEWVESLNESAAERLVQLVQRHQQENKTVICVCHNFRIVKSLADHILIIAGGKLFRSLSRDQLKEDSDLMEHVEKAIAS